MATVTTEKTPRFSLHFWRKVRNYAVLVALALFFVVPFYAMVSTALKTEEQLFQIPPVWIPHPFAWENFIQVFKEVPFGRFIINSAFLVTVNVIGQVIATSLVAYGFSRFRFWGRDVLFVILLATLMIPKQVVLVPQFILFARLGWVNTYLPRTVPAFMGSAFLIFMVRQYMMSIPLDLDEAAMIDGANRWQILWRIIFPISTPILVLVIIFTFVDVWNDFMGPLIYLNDPLKFTVSLGLSFFQGAKSTSWHLLMAAVMMAMIPPITLFLIAQKRLLGGIAAAGIKG